MECLEGLQHCAWLEQTGKAGLSSSLLPNQPLDILDLLLTDLQSFNKLQPGFAARAAACFKVTRLDIRVGPNHRKPRSSTVCNAEELVLKVCPKQQEYCLSALHNNPHCIAKSSETQCIGCMAYCVGDEPLIAPGSFTTATC